MKHVIILFAICALFGCKNKNTQESNYKVPDAKMSIVVKGKIQKASSLKDLFYVKRIIPLETKEESLIGTIESVIYRPEENRIIILDKDASKGVFVFDSNGKYINKIGKEGSGPGEYKNLQAIAYEDSIIAVYSIPFKLLFYKIDGTFIKEINMSKEKWMFSVEKMLLYRRELYIYTNNSAYNRGEDGNKYRVFKIRNYEEYSGGYGEPEETFDFSSGDIIIYNNRVVFSSVFNGNIYQIVPGQSESKIFASFGYLCDLTKIKSSQDKIMYLVKNINELDSFIQLGEVEKALFIEMHKKIVVTDNDGKIINKSIKKDIELPEKYSGYAARLGFIFYSNGIIIPSTFNKPMNNEQIPNPSLIFYEIK